MNDTFDQLKQYLGVVPYSNNNPILDTVLFGMLFRIGYVLFGHANFGVAVAVGSQMLLMAAGFAYACCTVRKITQSQLCEALLLVFFALNPIFGGAAQVLLKDSLHMAMFLTWLAAGFALIRRPDSQMNVIGYCIAAFFCAMTRKGALLYTAAGCAAMALYFYRGQYGYLSVRSDFSSVSRAVRSSFRLLRNTLLLCLGLYMVIEQLLLPLLGVKPAPQSENFSAFYQQVIYTARVHREALTQEEREGIDAVLDLEASLEAYDPNIADPVKATYHARNDQMAPFWRVYAGWWVKYPADMLKGWLTSTWKYAYPFQEGISYYRHYYARFQSIGMVMYVMSPEKIRLAVIDFLDHGLLATPFGVVLVSCGLYAWLFLFSIGRMLRKRRYELLIGAVPLAVLALGLMVTHVNGEVRYAYPLIASALPMVLLSLPQERFEPALRYRKPESGVDALKEKPAPVIASDDLSAGDKR